MKKLGKKPNTSNETLEAYSCSCNCVTYSLGESVGESPARSQQEDVGWGGPIKPQWP